MSQEEITGPSIEIARIEAEGLSKQAAAAKMTIDNPDSTLRGIWPETVEGYWVGMFEKSALSKFDDDNTDSAPVGAGSSGFDHDISMDTNPDTSFSPEHEDEAEDTDLFQKLIGDKLDKILERLEVLCGPDADSGDDFGPDLEGSRGRFESAGWGGDDEGSLDHSAADTDREQMRIRANAIKVTKEREAGVTLEDGKESLMKAASTHPKMKSYDVIDFDVSADGKHFEGYLAPKNRRR